MLIPSKVPLDVLDKFVDLDLDVENIELKIKNIKKEIEEMQSNFLFQLAKIFTKVEEITGEESFEDPVEINLKTTLDQIKTITGETDEIPGIPIDLTAIDGTLSDINEETARLDGFIKAEVLKLVNKLLEITGETAIETIAEINLKSTSDQIVKITGELTDDVAPKSNISNIVSLLSEIVGVDTGVPLSLDAINTKFNTLDSDIGGLITRLSALETEVFPPPPEEPPVDPPPEEPPPEEPPV